jgi:hypothetical protein
MATGDVILSLAIEGGVTKTVTLDSATRVLSRAHVAASDASIDTDAEWAVVEINKLGNVVLHQANSQAQSAASWTAKTFTKAT